MSFVRLSGAITIAILALNCAHFVHDFFDLPPVFEFTGVGILGVGAAVLLICATLRVLTMQARRILRLSYIVVAALTVYAIIHLQLVLIQTRDVLPVDFDGLILFLVHFTGSNTSAALSINTVCDAIDIYSNPRLKRASRTWSDVSRITALVWILSAPSCAFITVYFWWMAYFPLALFALYVHRRIIKELREMRDSVVEATKRPTCSPPHPASPADHG